MQGQYSLRSPAVKRLMKEAQELREPTSQFHAQPLEDNLFEWHFTIRGPDDTDFVGGVYHGRIILPPEYPMKPPSIIVLTPNGRFEINNKICLSISGHHPESWQPSWSIRTALLAIIGFMPTHGGGAIGSLDYSVEERKKLAKRSQDFKCPQCGAVNSILKPVSETSEAEAAEAKELASQINFQGVKKDDKKSEPTTPTTTQSPEPTSTSSVPASPTTPTAPQSPPPGANSPPWQTPWQQGMQRFPFMPFMRPPMMMPPPTSTAASTSGNPMMGNSAAAMSMHMAAMQAAWQQQMRFPQNPMMTRIPGINPISSAQSSTSSTSAPTSSSSSSSNTTSTTATTQATTPSSSSSTPTTTTAESSSNAAESSSNAPAVCSSNTPATTTATTSTEGARQRVATARVNTSTRSAEIPRRATGPPPARRHQSRQTSVCFSIVMTILAAAFLLLLLRRLSIMGIIQYEQDEL